VLKIALIPPAPPLPVEPAETPAAEIGSVTDGMTH